MKKFDKVYDVEATYEVRIAFDEVLWDYVQSDGFKKNFYNFHNKSELVRFLSKLAIDGTILSSVDGFGKEHDSMFDVLYLDGPQIGDCDIEEQKNIRWE